MWFKMDPCITVGWGKCIWVLKRCAYFDKVVHTQEMRSRGSIQEVPGEEVFKELLSYFGESHV